MVEYQIVALKVFGSNPDIYPLLKWAVKSNLVRNNNYKNLLSFFLKNTLLLKNLFNYVKLDYMFFNKIKFLFKYSNLFLTKINYSTVFKTTFKLDKSLFHHHSVKHRSFFKKNSNTLFNKTLFLNFIKLNTWLPTPRLTAHPSFNIFYYFNKDLNLGCFNITKTFNLWTSIIIFITNIFFYNLNYLVFGTSYFKYEILSLNWNSIKFNQRLWKYTQPFTFFLSNKTTLRNKYYFAFLLTLNYRISFVSDIHYHVKTIFYFNYFKYISVGPVPISSNFYLLSLTMPVSSNFLFSNLFFIRLLLKMKKNTSKLMYDNYTNSKY